MPAGFTDTRYACVQHDQRPCLCGGLRRAGSPAGSPAWPGRWGRGLFKPQGAKAEGWRNCCLQVDSFLFLKKVLFPFQFFIFIREHRNTKYFYISCPIKSFPITLIPSPTSAHAELRTNQVTLNWPHKFKIGTTEVHFLYKYDNHWEDNIYFQSTLHTLSFHTKKWLSETKGSIGENV